MHSNERCGAPLSWFIDRCDSNRCIGIVWGLDYFSALWQPTSVLPGSRLARTQAFHRLCTLSMSATLIRVFPLPSSVHFDLFSAHFPYRWSALRPRPMSHSPLLFTQPGHSSLFFGLAPPTLSVPCWLLRRDPATVSAPPAHVHGGEGVNSVHSNFLDAKKL